MKKFVICVIFFMAVLLLARNGLVKWSLEQGIQQLTGLPLSIAKLEIGLLEPQIRIQGLRILNPSSYRQTLMLDVPEIYVRYEPLRLLRRYFFVTEARIHLRELNVIKEADGQLNLNAFKNLKREPTEGSDVKTSKSTAWKFYIDTLQLEIGKVSYQDLSQSPPLVKTFDLNIKESLQQINNPRMLLRLIIFRALSKTSIETLTNFSLNELKSGLFNTLPNIPSNTFRKTSDILKKSEESLKKLLPGYSGE